MPTESNILSRRALAAMVGCCLVAGCDVRQQPPVTADYGPPAPVDVSHIPDAVPRQEARSRYGNPASYEVNGTRYQVLDSSQGYQEKGIASWYGLKFHGRRTSSWEPYDMYQMTAAHKSLPLPSYVRVRNLENGRQVVVRVNDRGPFHPQRIIDLSYAAASKLGVLEKGTALVEVTALNPAEPAAGPAATLLTDATDNQKPAMFLQVGAFGSDANAARHRDALVKAVSWPVRIENARQNGQAISRVQIGPLASVEQLDKLVLQLEQLGINDAHVVIR